ncbi:unnamed protein product [Closterium sp. Naga37s-1]|nr:unnamed protein product [Closterium sp. Naga37s-1]
MTTEVAGRNIIVAVDESEQSFYALQWAFDHIIRKDADKTILVTVETPITSSAGAFAIPEDNELSVEDDKEQETKSVAERAEAICKENQVTSVTKVYQGEAREAICQACEENEASMLVIGSHGHGPVKRSFLGSVSDYCSKYARCPVVAQAADVLASGRFRATVLPDLPAPAGFRDFLQLPLSLLPLPSSSSPPPTSSFPPPTTSSVPNPPVSSLTFNTSTLDASTHSQEVPLAASAGNQSVTGSTTGSQTTLKAPDSSVAVPAVAQVLTVAAQVKTTEAVRQQMVEKAVQVAGGREGSSPGALLLLSGAHPMRSWPLVNRLMPTNSLHMLREAHRLREAGQIPQCVQLWAVENPLTGSVDRLEHKLEAGAEAIILQPPVVPEAFQQWWCAAEQRGLTTAVPMIIGVPLITSARNLAFWMLLTDAKGGQADAEIARYRQEEERLAGTGVLDVDQFRAFRQHWTEQYLTLAKQLKGASGVHAMPINPRGWKDLRRSILTGALERLLVWDVRKGTLLQQLSPQPVGAGYSQGGGAGAAGSAAGSVHDAVPAVADVTAICPSPADATQVAAGYTDGTVRVWNMVDGTCRTSLAGHRSAVAVVRYNAAGALLASGGRDADIVVWDVAGEVGLVRLRGHRDQRHIKLALHHCIHTPSLTPHPFPPFPPPSPPPSPALKLSSRPSLALALHNNSVTRANKGGSYRRKNGEVRRGRNGGETREKGREKVRVVSGSITCLPPPFITLPSLFVHLPIHAVPFTHSSIPPSLSPSFPHPLNPLFPLLSSRSTRFTPTAAPGRLLSRLKSPHDSRRQQHPGGSAAVCRPSTSFGVDSEALSPSPSAHPSPSLRSTPYMRTAAPGQSTLYMRTAAPGQHRLLSGSIHTIHADSSTRAASLQSAGHRSDVRSLALSSDGSLLLSVSKGSAKVWNPVTGACLSSFDSGYGLCCLFAPGDRYAIAGTQAGDLEVFSVASAERTALIQAAHDKAVWAMAALPDNTGFATASADGCVKFWEFQMQLKGSDADKDALAAGRGEKYLTVVNKRTLKMSDDVLSVAFSPDGRYIALSLLDSTIKVFFVDSLRFFLSLYGHKLPAICLDISSDSQLAVSGSADKSVKIWGLDFGDCHRSLFAHQDSVMSVKFVPRTHYFFSCGKDRRVRYWDADKFQLLLTLDGHHAEVWSLAISPLGDFLVSGSHDRSIRRWQRTDEPFFLEEEREKQLEAMFEARAVTLPTDARRPEGGDDEEGGEGGEAAGPGGAAGELGGVGGAARGTQETVWAADSIIEAVELASMEEARMVPFIKDPSDPTSLLPSFQPNVLLLGHAPAAFVLRALARVKPSELEQALLVLPFTVALRILHFAPHWLHRPLPQLEFAARALVSLVRIHHSQLVATPTARPLLAAVHTLLRASLKGAVATVGCNLAAISHIKSLLASSQASIEGGDGTGMAEKVKEIRERLAKGRNAVVAEKLQRNKAEKRKRRAEKQKAKS